MNLVTTWLGQRWEWRDEQPAVGTMAACMGVYLALLVALFLAIVLGNGWIGPLGIISAFTGLVCCWLPIWMRLFVHRRDG